MCDGRFQLGVCWLLSAVLTANNGLPFTLEHAHPVGKNLQHDHRYGSVLASSPQRSPPSDVESTTSIFAVTAHIHLVWLGFEFTVLPTGEQGAGEDDSPSVGASLVRLADHPLFDIQGAMTLPPADFQPAVALE